MALLKYALDELLGSGARVLYSDDDYTLPVTSGAPTLGIHNIISVIGPDYAAQTGWNDLGGSREGQGAQYERNIETNEWNLEQATGAVAEDITDVPRSMTVQMAEIKPEHVSIIEEAPASRAIAAAAGAAGTGRAAQTAVDFGDIENLTRRAWAIIGQRRKGVGADVTEAANGNEVRGGLAAVVLYSATISSEAAQFELQKGQMSNIPVQLRAFPHVSITDGQRARGTWLFEDAPATIAAV
jgi:hypothetical protein